MLLQSDRVNRSRRKPFLTILMTIWMMVGLWAGPAISQELDIPYIITPADQERDVPYVPTPAAVVEEMMRLAGVGPGDYVIDLGSGDGRIVISAALNGAVGHGVDLDTDLLESARDKAKLAGVEDRVVFLREDLFETEIREASVITLYLLSSVNRELRPRLLQELRPGTRVVSHRFDMAEWKPDSTVTMETDRDDLHHLYLWIIPDEIDGRWEWEQGDTPYYLSIRQTFQEITVDLRTEPTVFETRNAVLRGNRLSFMARSGATRYVYSGHIREDTISGTIQLRENGAQRITDWGATRR